MNLRKIKCNMCLLFVFKTDELLLNFFIIKKRKLIFPYLNFLGKAGVFVEIVIFAHVSLVENLVNCFTSLTAEFFVVKLYIFCNTIITAVIALDGLFCS